MKRLKGFLTFTLFGSVAFGAIPQTQMTSIYRSPESLFSSGELSVAELGKMRSNYSVKQWQQIKIKDKSFWLPEERFFQSMEFSQKLRITAETFLLKSPYAYGQPIFQLKSGMILRALDFQDDWVQVFIESPNQDQKIGWIPLFFVESVPQDSGFVYTRYNSYLFSLASGGSKVLQSIPIGTRLAPLSWDDEWIKVQIGSQLGYVPLNHTLTRYHFAERIFYKEKWYKMDLKAFPKILLTPGNETITPNQIASIQVDPSNKGFILTSDLEAFSGPSFQSPRVPLGGDNIGVSGDLLKYQYQTWILSLTDSHGPVWWTKDAPVTADERQLTSAEILKKPILELATHPSNGKKSLLVSTGVFLSDDGLQWRKIKDFKNENHPVAINSKGEYFVGDRWSTDGGLSFKPYIKWDSLSTKIATLLGKTPEALIMKGVEATKDGLKIKLAAGSQTLLIQGTPGLDLWRLRKIK